MVVACRDASLDVRGELRIYHSDGREMVDAGRVLLCRCGHSANKPFCDFSHERVGFRSYPAETSRDRLEAETPRHSQRIRAFPIHTRPLRTGDGHEWISSSPYCAASVQGSAPSGRGPVRGACPCW